MTDEDVNKIGGLVDSKLDALRKDIKGDINSALKPINKKLDILWDQVERVTMDLGGVKETLDSHTTTLKRIETKVEGNYDDIRKLDKRLIKVENRSGIMPPPELTINR